jgi:hypothetical protein
MEQQAWVQGWEGGIPQDQNHKVNEVQISRQVETNVEIKRRLIHEDICRAFEQQVERHFRNLPQDQQGDEYL